jgi:CelD/BcsL family acetyltransferase involved in cellulose biosynthesis/peptidoglycan/xylan/chitin deacetylase (PgdA/CDA1 family)
MKIVEIREEAEWRKLQPVWNALVVESDSATLFLTWEWMSAWWSAYGTPGSLNILVALDESGILRGIAPLRRHILQRYGRTVPALTWLADGSNDSDYLDFILARGWERPVMEAFHAHWANELQRGAVLAINEIPEHSAGLAILKELASASGFLWKETPVACATLHLPETWEAYQQMLKPRFRTKIRSVLRNLESRPEVRFGFCQTAADAERLLPALFDLHTRRWREDGKPGVFGWEQKRAFYAALTPLLLERNWLRFSFLSWNGAILACQYGFQYGNTYLHLQEGYEPASEHWNVGAALRAWTIREFLQQGVREYDFLAGIGRHKMDWGAQAKQSKQVLLGPSTFRNQLLLRGPEWEERMKESVKQLLPETVLAARRRRLERMAARQHPGRKEPAGEGWMRQAAAKCYFYLGVPALTRQLRHRYELSLPSKGGRPVLGKRRRPVGRILYYHRINEERDPFVPALTPELFERQMRFISRNYKVLSLADLLKHIENGPPELAVAVTFDDGYRDNYDHAFPILQRYRIPATIFLTTGGIDSGEALWFEQLAIAIQKTGREFLDLELDVPRRFWMRSVEERLRANGEIFSLLRAMPDRERRAQLDVILERLGKEAAATRKGRMLTWDQIRDMRAHGIDFGGHTVTHPFLSKLSPEDAAWEVSECRRRIEQELQVPVEHFAYPNGRREDFSEATKHALRTAGYRAAVSTIWGVNDHTTDRMELRRGQPWEEDPAVFAYKLDWYQWVNG